MTTFSTVGTIGIYACEDSRLRGRRSRKHKINAVQNLEKIILLDINMEDIH